jgi:hypothetical protein
MVKAEQSRISQSLVEGHAVNFETYQRLVGQHQGLAKALDILDEILKEPDDNE